MSTHPIQITDLSIHPVHDPGDIYAVKALVSVVLNDAFVINGLRIVDGKFGLFIVFPRENGKMETICFPIRNALHEEMSRVILNAYCLRVRAK